MAQGIRVGLTLVNGSGKTARPDVLDELFYGKPKRQCVFEFAALFAIIALIIGGWLLYAGSSGEAGSSWERCFGWVAVAAVLLLLGRLAPIVLYPLWKLWMGFAHILGRVVTFFLISLVWCTVTIPIGLTVKLIGKKLMDLRFRDESVSSYYDAREPGADNFKFFERQY